MSSFSPARSASATESKPFCIIVGIRKCQAEVNHHSFLARADVHNLGRFFSWPYWLHRRLCWLVRRLCWLRRFRCHRCARWWGLRDTRRRLSLGAVLVACGASRAVDDFVGEWVDGVNSVISVAAGLMVEMELGEKPDQVGPT